MVAKSFRLCVTALLRYIEHSARGKEHPDRGTALESRDCSEAEVDLLQLAVR